MSIQNILQKILEQAQQDAEIITKKAQKEAENFKKDIIEKWNKKNQDLTDSIQKKSDKALKKAKYLAEVEGKNKLLAKKSEIIERILNAVINKLSSIPAKDYEQLLAELINSIDLENATIFPAEGKENSTKGAVKLARKKFNIGDSKKIQGGFLVQADLIDIDFSFENLIKKKFRGELEELIVSELFNV